MRSRTSRKKETFDKGDSSTDGVEKVERDGVPSQEHQLVLLALRGDKNVVSKGPRNAAIASMALAHGTNMKAMKVIERGHPWGMTMGCLWGFPSMPATELW